MQKIRQSEQDVQKQVAREEEYAFKSNISLSLVPYKELLDQMMDMEKAQEREKYTGFIIESLNKVFTSPTDRVYHDESKHKGISDRSLDRMLKRLASISESLSKIVKPV